MTQPSTGPDETLARLTELARQALSAQADLARASLVLGRATLAGGANRSGAGRAYLEALGREGARYWQDLGALGLDYASEVLALQTRAAARVVREATAASHHGGAGQPPGAATEEGTGQPRARRARIHLRGVVGQTAQGTVTVRNNHARARRVVLTAGQLTDSAGVVVVPTLRVEPSRVTIPPGEEHLVRIAVDLDAEDVVAGATYVGVVEVTGGDEATLEVSVEVLS